MQNGTDTGRDWRDPAGVLRFRGGEEVEGFRLVTSVRRGSASNYPAAWAPYDTLEAARAGAAALLKEERVTHVIIVRNSLQREFVEWCAR